MSVRFKVTELRSVLSEAVANQCRVILVKDQACGGCRDGSSSNNPPAEPRLLLSDFLNRPSSPHPAQQDSCFTSLLKVCAASFSPSTIVR